MREEINVVTEKGDLHIDEGRMIGLLKSPDGRLFIGTGEEGSDQLEVTGKISASNLLEACQPANFELSMDEDGDSFIKPVLMEQKVTLTEKISRITLTEQVSENTIKVLKVEINNK